MGEPQTVADSIEFRVEDMRGNVVALDPIVIDTNPETRTFTAPDALPVAIMFDGKYRGRTFSGFERVHARAGQTYSVTACGDYIEVLCIRNDHSRSVRAGECAGCLEEDQEKQRAAREKVKTR